MRNELHLAMHSVAWCIQGLGTGHYHSATYSKHSIATGMFMHFRSHEVLGYLRGLLAHRRARIYTYMKKFQRYDKDDKV